MSRKKLVLVALLAVGFAAVNFATVSAKEPPGPVELAVVGDAPYGRGALERFPLLVESINWDPSVQSVVHIGDIKDGSAECTDAWNMSIRAAFDSFADPLVYTPGDNEWSDCHEFDGGATDPLERLDAVRDTFFPKKDRTLGGGKFKVKTQDKHFPENVRWEESDVMFATMHVVGSNNDLLPWTNETPAQTTARFGEFLDRNDANIEWLEKTFKKAKKSAGLALFLHADMWNPVERAQGVPFDGYTNFVERLAELSAEFGRPVVIVSGDTHGFRVDPGVEWFSLYGVAPQPNVTQIIVDVSVDSNSINWLRLVADPSSPTVFSWEEVELS